MTVNKKVTMQMKSIKITKVKIKFYINIHKS